MTDVDKTDEQIIAELFGRRRKPRTRAKPHRCHDCNKVTRHVRCDDCAKKAREGKAS